MRGQRGAKADRIGFTEEVGKIWGDRGKKDMRVQ